MMDGKLFWSAFHNADEMLRQEQMLFITGRLMQYDCIKDSVLRERAINTMLTGFFTDCLNYGIRKGLGGSLDD